MVRALSRSRPNSGVSMKSAMTRPEPKTEDVSKSLGERLSAYVLGVKGSSLASQEFGENPMARLKLLLVSIAFISHRSP